MKKCKNVISFLVVLLAFSCNADFFTEQEEDSQVVAYDGEFQRVAGEDLDDTWWEIVKDEWAGHVIDYPLERILHYNESDSLDEYGFNEYVENYDPDNDGAKEWAEEHCYYHFKDNKAVYYEKVVVYDEGEVQGEYIKEIWNSLGKDVTAEMYAVHDDWEIKIVDGVIHIVGSEGTDAIYYNIDEMYMMYEDNGIGKTTLKKVSYDDIK